MFIKVYIFLSIEFSLKFVKNIECYFYRYYNSINKYSLK